MAPRLMSFILAVPMLATSLGQIVSFEMSPNPAIRGEVVTLTWETENAHWVEVAPWDRGWRAEDWGLPLTGSVQLRADSSRLIGFTAGGDFGTDRTEVELEVLEKPSFFQAKPITLAAGGGSVVRWNVEEGGYGVMTLNERNLRGAESRALVRPTNERVQLENGVWRRAAGDAEEGWTQPEFNDDDWLESGSPTEAGFYRFNFDYENPEELSLAILRLTAENGLKVGSNEVWVNGRTYGNQLRLVDPFNQGWTIESHFLRAKGNVLAVRLGGLPSDEGFGFEVAAWRQQETPTLFPLTLRTVIDGVETSETINLTILPGDADLPPPLPIAISEFHSGDWLPERPDASLLFFELTNRGDERVDLRGMQVIGQIDLDFEEAGDPVLLPGQFGVVPLNQIYMRQAFKAEMKILGVGSSCASPIFDCNSGTTLLDSYGRVLEYSPPFFGPTYLILGGERTNFEGRADDPFSWRGPGFDPYGGGGGSPGEDFFEIEEFKVTPEIAQPGEVVTLSWRVSRPVDLFISEGVGKVTGTEGSLEVQIPDDGSVSRFDLFATTPVISRRAHVSITISPIIRFVESNVRVVEPYQPFTLKWIGGINVRIQPDPGILRYRWRNGLEIFAGAGGFGKNRVWSYLRENQEVPPTWRDREFPPGEWRSKSAALGVNRPVASEIVRWDLSDPKANYLRRNFILNNVAEVERLVIDLLAEDGAVVYLNGAEALRVNLPDGEITQDTHALSDRSAGELTYETYQLEKGLLVDGKNVIAVSLHPGEGQADSPVDLAFDLALRAERPIPENGQIRYTITSENEAGRDEATLTLIVGERVSLAEWQQKWSLKGNAAANDQDGDGLADLLEYMVGSNPLEPSPIPLKVARAADGHFEITYRQQLAATGYRLQVEFSTNLRDWQNIDYYSVRGFRYEDDVIEEGDTIAVSKFRSVGKTPRALRYFRLRVVRDESRR